ncbi:Subtilisin [Orbilia brochopaga]|nr:Subtilisin [Drechslerella brochopaga]
MHIELAKPKDADGFIELLNNLAVVMKDDRSKSQPPPETAQVSSKTKPLLGPLIRNLFSTLSVSWRGCGCKSPHQAALALCANRACPADDDASASFTVLLSNPMSRKPVIRWLETDITVRESLPNPLRVNLGVDGRSLFRRGETGIQMKKFKECEPVSLSSGFLENDAELGFEGKICLAVVLSFSFLDFCGKPWFPRGWTKDTIHLMQDDDSLSLQPFLVTDILSDRRGPSTGATAAIWEAKLLHHGILLMEIFQQDTLRLRPKQEKTLPSQKDMAKAWFKSIKWDVCERWAQAVEACINGTLIDGLNASSRLAAQDAASPLGSQPPTPAEISSEIFAKVFYEEILAPLEADFASQWPNQNPDQAISTLKLPSMRKSPVSSPRRQPETSKHRQGVSPKPRTPYAPRPPHRWTQPQPRQPTSRSRAVNPRIGQGRFFDTSNSPDSADALDWFRYFDEIEDKLPKGKKVRIGVLDTGIDLKNTWISQKIGRIRCWPRGVDCHDNDGHGTHVAHLLLRLTKHAHLRVCKVTKSTYIKDADVERIANAINHFSEPGEDHVDILSLSFGFPKYDDVLKPINDAIRNARSNGVIIFAAAGNEGGNASVFWPASLHETGDVIRINSSDGKGSPSSFNPDPEIGRWICTLGQAVPSCQADLRARPDGHPQVIYRSGSSFATPIAAAIAAIILGVMDHIDESRYSQYLLDLRPRLRTRLGMEKVLCGTCVQQVGHGRLSHIYLTPWYFFKSEENIQVPMVLRILEDVPP